MKSAQLFTAGDLAAALGCTGRAVRLRLTAVAATGEAPGKGGRAPAWSIEALPEKMRTTLTTEARRRGYRDELSLLTTAPRTQWHPRPGTIAANYVEKAKRLRAAFAGTFARLNDLAMPEGEFRERGRTDYRATFGHEISEKHWLRLLNRTVARDDGAENFQRWEIYLDENHALAEPVATVARALAGCAHPDLKQLVDSFAKHGDPSETETAVLWQATFERFNEMVEARSKAKAARRSLLDFLHSHVPALAKNRHALHVAFNYKLARWRENGATPAALNDGRTADARRRELVISEDDRNTLLAFAAKLGGGLSQAWRETIRRGVLSSDLCARYLENPASKSHVPTAIREALANDLNQLSDSMRGPRRATLNGAFIERDPTTYAAGDAFQGDDLTLPNLYWEETAAGARLMRGQFLALIDTRSTYILGFVLISAPQDRPSTYNASHVRNLITVVHDCYGLPRRAFYFENGTWRAKALTGGALDGFHTEAGLREFGVRFIHARLPRAKVIERVFGALQNLTQAEPGYVGRGWHSDRYERVEKHQRDVQSGRVAPGEHFLSRDEWMERLAELVDQYNNEPQGGKYCAGLSPREAYETHFGSEQLTRLPDSARYLLANERKALRVGRNGVSFASRGERYTYKSERTGELRNRTVEVFWNYESPEIAGVKHPDSGEVFAVRRATVVDGFDAPAEQLAEAQAENAAHESYRRALYRAVSPKFSEHFMVKRIFRPTLVDSATADAGQQLSESVTAEKAAVTREKRLRRQTAIVANGAGLHVRAAVRDPEQVLSATEELSRLLLKAEQHSTP